MAGGAGPDAGACVGKQFVRQEANEPVDDSAILPATQSILNSNFRGRDRAIAFGIWGAVIGGVAALGPLIGGWLTTNLSWRWAFYLNVPIGIIALVGTLMFISESKDEEAQPGFDLPGFVLITLGLGGVVFALIEGRQYGWITPDAPFTILGWTWPSDAPISIIPVAIVGGLLALVAFYFVETRRERRGQFFLFDFELWRYRAFHFGNLAGTIVSLGEFGLLFVLPLFLQSVLGCPRSTPGSSSSRSRSGRSSRLPAPPRSRAASARAAWRRWGWHSKRSASS